jgi:hypothetical protein
MVQLEQLKRMGPMEPVEAKPVPCGEQIIDFITVDKMFPRINGCIAVLLLFSYLQVIVPYKGPNATSTFIKKHFVEKPECIL